MGLREEHAEFQEQYTAEWEAGDRASAGAILKGWHPVGVALGSYIERQNKPKAPEGQTPPPPKAQRIYAEAGGGFRILTEGEW